MAYLIRNDLLSFISDSQLDNFTDDLGDGSETTNNLNTVMQMASDTADSYVASIYATPFNPVPKKIKQAATIFACEALYSRRLTPEEKNPYKERADLWRTLLTQIGAGKQPLDESFARAFQPGATVTQQSLITVDPITLQQISTM